MLAGVGVVLDGGDAADRAAVPLGDEVLRFGMLEEGILARREEGPDVHPQLRHPERVAAVQVVRKTDEPLQTAPVGDGHDLRSAQMTPSSFPSRPKTSSAWSICCAVWVAIKLVRSRQCDGGTAGGTTGPVVPPAVPPSHCRLRTSLMATHTAQQIDHALEVFGRLGKELGVI